MSHAQAREGERAGEGAEEGGERHKLEVKLSKQPVRDTGIKPQQAASRGRVAPGWAVEQESSGASDVGESQLCLSWGSP